MLLQQATEGLGDVRDADYEAGLNGGSDGSFCLSLLYFQVAVEWVSLSTRNPASSCSLQSGESDESRQCSGGKIKSETFADVPRGGIFVLGAGFSHGEVVLMDMGLGIEIYGE